MSESLGIRLGVGHRGRGVFATKNFKTGQVVEECPVLKIPQDQVPAALTDYIFSDDTSDTVVLLLGYGMMYNHSDPANLTYYKWSDNSIAFVATKDISAGEELTINYGRNWWHTRDKTPS